MRRHALFLIVLLVLSVPAVAAAQSTVSTTPTLPPTTTTTPETVAPPATGSFSLTAEKVGSSHAALAGRHFRVRGVIEPYVAGQTATVRVYRGNTKLSVRHVSLQQSSSGKSGFFVVGETIKRPGRLTIKATHLATPQLAQVVARPETVDILPSHVNYGSRGESVRILQRLLRGLHYVVGKLGVFDDRTARAVMAFRKLNNMARTQVADSAVFKRLARGGSSFAVRYPDHGRHVEADLTHQVLALIGSGGHVERIYPLSSGKPSTPTVLGSFHVYSKTPGTNAKGMVFSNYFIGGYAIHGYYDVPPYAASHGCLRVPIPDAIPIYDWISYGTPVDVFYR